MSRAFGQLADVPIPRTMRRVVLGTFARGVGIDLSEAELPLEDYPTLNAFFVRRLRRGARSWPTDTAAASPVDGVLGQLGRLRDGRAVQAKGRWYTVEDLLSDSEEAARYTEGSFLTLYLSPRHYHRIHAPCTGAISKAAHLPGALLPVNAAAVAHVPNLFPRNERLVGYIDGEMGRLALVAVGAYNVGRISAAFDPSWRGDEREEESRSAGPAWVTNKAELGSTVHRYEPPVPVQRGEEIMAFHLGSTVVLLFEPSSPPLRPELRSGDPVRLGQAITQSPG